MNITTIRTPLIHANEYALKKLIVECLPSLAERTVFVISSKVVSLCQNRVVDPRTMTKSALIKQEADYYTPDGFNAYGGNFTILNNTLIRSAGIDESNTGGYFLLWPKDPQATANEIRAFLCRHFSLQNVGVIITDSSSMPPLRGGAIGIMLAHSGFLAVESLAGTEDLFQREFKVARSAIGSSLAAAANVVMGEGAEQTPIALISDVPFVTFQNSDPTSEELGAAYIPLEDDLYAPFLQLAMWKKGANRR